jgi:hypothetical protein
MLGSSRRLPFHLLFFTEMSDTDNAEALQNAQKFNNVGQTRAPS